MGTHAVLRRLRTRATGSAAPARAVTCSKVLLALALITELACTHRALSELDPDAIDVDVDIVPPGDAAGRSFSGRYEVRATQVACAGACEHETDAGAESRCRVGASSVSQVSLTHEDGALTLLVADARPDEYLGGVDASGSFDAVGEAEENDGAVLVRNRVVGAISSDGELVGVAVSRRVGDVEQGAVDCRLTYDLEGERVD